MSDDILNRLARRLLKCPFDSELFDSQSELGTHLSASHGAQICKRHRVPRLEPVEDIERPKKMFMCGICFGFMVPDAVGRSALSEIPAHIKAQHPNPSGGPTQVSLSWSTDPELINRFMADEALEEVCACNDAGCSGVFANEDSVATHWVGQHCTRPSADEVQAALAVEPERFSSLLEEILSEFEAGAIGPEPSFPEPDDGYRIRHSPSVPRVRSRPSEFVAYIDKQLVRLREDDFEAFLNYEGFDIEADEVPAENWVEGQQQIAQLDLRFCNIVDGYIPLVKSIRRILPPLADGQTVDVSWQSDPEVWFPCKVSKSKRAIYNLEGRLKTVFAGLPSGVRLYVTRVGQRRYRLGVRRESHIVPNCKFFVQDDAGGWDIEIRDAQVEWETGNDVFRHQLTFQEMDALHAEARRTNLSVRDAVHEVMKQCAQNSSLHIREVYDIVFLWLRTCSLGSVWAQFRSEHECYVRVAPCRYRFDPAGRFPEIRYVQAAPRLPDEPSLPQRSEIQEPLLRAIILLGGSIVFSEQGRGLEISLANEFGLPDAVRDFAAPRYNSQGHRKWRNHLQFVKDELVNLGQIDASVRDTWRVTDAGYRRVGVQRR